MADTGISAEKLERVARAIFMTDYGHIGPEAWETARLDGNSERPEAFVKARAAIAALDEAPEPEWEYQWGEPGESFEGFDSYATEELARAEMELDSECPSRRVMRRRKAGPWLPVEGEKP